MVRLLGGSIGQCPGEGPTLRGAVRATPIIAGGRRRPTRESALNVYEAVMSACNAEWDAGSRSLGPFRAGSMLFRAPADGVC
jgi:hypothetical protein